MVSEIKRLLKAREAKRANFYRQTLQTKVKLADTWRRPRGLHSKQRMYFQAKGAHPQTGFGSPKAVRGFHPSGYREVLVFTTAELADVDPATTAVRIGASVGGAKRAAIQTEAEKLGIKILNKKEIAAPVKVEAAPALVEEPKAEDKKAAKKTAKKAPAKKEVKKND
ncbi:MAG TPA: 50S ribosomal protein L32e [Methanocorpusculum sp.]|nr:50S ribosomal protein L32e [Methanocorpusculum sp.]